jgi:hypothetical protein
MWKRGLAIAVMIAGCSRSNDAEPVPQPPAPIVVPPVVPAIAPAAPVVVTRGTLAVSRGTVCARTADAGMACWGDAGPPRVVAGLGHVAGVAASAFELCAWRDDGRATCGIEKPRVIAGVDHVVELAGGIVLMCARHHGGHVACWAREMKDDTAPLVIHEVPQLDDAVEIAVAGEVACARRADHSVTCWDGASPAAGALAAVPAAAGALSLSGGGEHFAAVTAAGAVGWSADDKRTPWRLPTLPAGTTRVALGPDLACALGAGVTCFDIDKRGTGAPHEMPGLAGATDVAIGTAVACARTADGHAKCWGYVDRLGTGETLEQRDPVDVAGLTDAVQIDAESTTCARRATGRVVCWGERMPGDPSDRDAARRPLDLAPVDVGIEHATDLEVGVASACARLAGGSTVCWGWKPPRSDTAWPKPTVVAAIPEGMDHLRGAPQTWGSSVQRESWACTRKGKGKLSCMDHFAGRHGEPDEPMHDPDLEALDDVGDLLLPGEDRVVYVLHTTGVVESNAGRDFHPVDGLADIAQIVRGSGPFGFPAPICARRKSGAVVCWTDPLRPDTFRTLSITDATQLVAPDDNEPSHVCALRATGRVSCWGDRDYLGDGHGSWTDTPVVVPGVAL